MNPSETPHESFKLPPKGPSEQGYTAPEGYFVDFSARLQTRLDLEQQPDQSDPSLSLGAQASPLVAPAGYFAAFPTRMMARIRQIETGNIKRLYWYQRPALQWSVAAAITLLLVVGIGLSRADAPKGFDDFSTEELLAMVEHEQVEADLILEIMGPFGEDGMDPNMEIFEEDQEWDALLEELDLEDLEAEWEAGS